MSERPPRPPHSWPPGGFGPAGASFDPVPPELNEEYDEYVDVGLALARGELPPDEAARVRERMDRDPEFRSVIQPLLEAAKAPKLGEAELQQRWEEFRRRAGWAPARVAPPDRLTWREWLGIRFDVSRRVLLAAASLVALLAIPAGVSVYRAIVYDVRSTPANATAEVRLPDGSIVQLARSSWMRYAANLGARSQRVVELRGHGTFTVSRIPSASFEVLASTARIIATGTRFEARAYESVAFIEVHEGSVVVQPLDARGEARGNPRALAAGGRITVTHGGVIE